MAKNGFSMDKQKVLVPKDMVTKPFFPAVQQDGPRTVVVSENTTYLIGYRDEKAFKYGIAKSFDIRHGRLIVILLGFLERHKMKQSQEDKKPIPLNLSIYQIGKIYFQKTRPNKREYDEILSLLGDLRSIAVKYQNEEDFRVFSILSFGMGGGVKDENKSGRIEITNIHISEDFVNYFLNVETLNIRSDVLFSLKSNMAMAIYFYVPSRAAKRSKSNPFTITLENLLKEVAKGKTFKSKSERLRVLYEPAWNRDIFKELDGKETLTGILRAAYEDAGTDYHAVFWIEKFEESATGSTFMEFVLNKHGFPKEKLQKLMSPPLNEYAEQKLKDIVDLEQSRQFYTMCQNIMGHIKFNSIVGQLAMELACGTGISSAGAVLGHRLKLAIEKYLEDIKADLFPEA